MALETRIEAGLPPAAGDAGRLQQVVWNLLSNAVKFTPAGGRIEIALAGGPAGLQLAVRDNGQGIPRELLPAVFDQFRQGRDGQETSGGGLGLGLAIVRHLVQLHGGTVHAHSEGPGRGARFVVDLPLTAPERRVEPSPSPAPAPAALTGIHVLVVEDADDTRDAIVLALAMQGARVTAAVSAAQAVARAAQDRPAIVITDIGLPDDTGVNLLMRLREIGVAAPMIALTAYGAPADRERSLAAGFALHLTKPFSPVDLGEAIRSVLPARAR